MSEAFLSISTLDRQDFVEKRNSDSHDRHMPITPN